jgi:hypothetical protein
MPTEEKLMGWMLQGLRGLCDMLEKAEEEEARLTMAQCHSVLELMRRLTIATNRLLDRS